MYNLRLFVHNKLVIIKVGMWQHRVLPIRPTEELQPNRLCCRDALNTQHVYIQSLWL